MKRIFKLSFALIVLILFAQYLPAQVIRKNWREMTTHEKDVYISALRALYNQSPNKIETYVTTHNNSTYVKHGVLDFLIWHRIFIYYFERELINSGVAGAANTALPYWGWETAGDWSSSSPMFSSGTNNLGLFGYSIPEGTFSRGFGQSDVQPTATELDNLSTNFTQFGSNVNTQQGTHFWPRLERVYHDFFHVFIGGSGGTMSNITISPRDPIFYLHHNYVDKIWQDWHNKNGSSTIANQNVLINTVPGQPQILRSGLVDSRSLKVWFAYNGQVKLDRYTVSNTENYRYTGIVNIANTAADPFTVPTGTVCNVVSGTTIVIKPGFTAQNGSAFSAIVDPVSNPSSTFNTGRRKGESELVKGENAFEEEFFTEERFQVFPNPSANGRFTVALLTNNDINYKYAVYDIMGKPIIVDNNTSSNKTFDVNLSEKPLGMYVLHLKIADNNKIYLKKIVSR